MAYYNSNSPYQHSASQAHLQTPGQYSDPYGSHESFVDDYSQQYDTGSIESRAPLVNEAPAYPPMPSPQQRRYSPPRDVPNPPRFQSAGSPYGEKVGSPYGSPYGQSPGYFPQQDNAYSHLHQKIMRRRSVKQIKLQNGNLVLDCPVPTSILQYAKQYPGAGEKEFTHMRYSAVTCDPDDFTLSNFKLRNHMWQRPTELAIVMTMYNEDASLFHRTWSAVVKNLVHFNSRDKSKVWGKDAWKKIVVVVVSDGRAKINQKTLKMLGLMGAFQEGVMKDTVAGKDVQSHVFEYTTQVTVDDQANVNGGIPPIQIIFCLKEKNAKKLNSHRWFFNSFCQQLNPNVCVLLDVGTKPTGTSLYPLWKAFDKNPHLGGACGEITVETGKGCSNLLRPLVAAQNFEYKMSNILDKPTESVFGYISVLPGAFSAYRYKALQNGPNGAGPLRSYFLGEKMHAPGATAGVFESNMFLAEDRILCFEIVTKPTQSWTLKYVKSAKASTDTPDTIDEFIGQRRRWNNGSFFAAVHASLHFYKIWTSGHNFFRKIWLTIEALYQFVQLLFSITMLANMYLSVLFVCRAAVSVPANDPFGGQGPRVVSILLQGWVAALVVCLVCSLGNRPRGSRFAYNFVAAWFAICFCVALYCSGWTVYLVFKELPRGLDVINTVKAIWYKPAFRDIVISLAATYLLYLLSSLLHFEPWHIFTCLIHIYAFSNTHDLSWGTKSDGAPAKDLGAAKTAGKEGKEAVEVALPTDADDINQIWLAMRKDLSTPEVKQKNKRDANQKQIDHYANARTNILLWYLGVNIFIAMFFSSEFFLEIIKQENGGQTVVTNPYLTFLFWSVAGISAIRFAGSTLYLILRLFGH